MILKQTLTEHLKKNIYYPSTRITFLHLDTATCFDNLRPSSDHQSSFLKQGAVQFKYLGTTLTNQHSIAEEIKSRLRLGNACYHSV